MLVPVLKDLWKKPDLRMVRAALERVLGAIASICGMRHRQKPYTETSCSPRL